MAKKRLKPFKEQWDSIAVVTVMIKGDAIQFTSEGCGDAGTLADGLVNAFGALMDRAVKQEGNESK